jgi:hypothetical protein
MPNAKVQMPKRTEVKVEVKGKSERIEVKNVEAQNPNVK